MTHFYCKESLSDEGWTEEKIKEYDALALEDHSHEATPARRGRRQRNWKIILNKGVEGKMRQRSDFREVKHAYRQLYKEHADEGTVEGAKSIHLAKQTRQNSQQQFDEHEVCVYTVHPRTGWKYYTSTSSSSSSRWQEDNELRSKQSWDY